MKRRRWGESGSSGRASGALAGVVRASSPPGAARAGPPRATAARRARARSSRRTAPGRSARRRAAAARRARARRAAPPAAAARARASATADTSAAVSSRRVELGGQAAVAAAEVERAAPPGPARARTRRGAPAAGPGRRARAPTARRRSGWPSPVSSPRMHALDAAAPSARTTPRSAQRRAGARALRATAPSPRRVGAARRPSWSPSGRGSASPTSGACSPRPDGALAGHVSPDAAPSHRAPQPRREPGLGTSGSCSCARRWLGSGLATELHARSGARGGRARLHARCACSPPLAQAGRGASTSARAGRAAGAPFDAAPASACRCVEYRRPISISV